MNRATLSLLPSDETYQYRNVFMGVEKDNRQEATWPDGCWPNRDQALLLKACLLEETNLAQEAFHAWEARIPFYLVDTGSRRLLLTLFQRFEAWGNKSSYADQWKVVVQRLWLRQQAVERELSDILCILSQAEIPTQLL